MTLLGVVNPTVIQVPSHKVTVTFLHSLIQASCSIDAIFADMIESLGSPSIMLVDLRPINAPVVVITDYTTAEQVTRTTSLQPTSLPKTTLAYLEPLLGSTSILVSHGSEWKALRKQFNPGFSPQHLMTLLPSILKQSKPLMNHLDNLVAGNTDFSLVEYLTNLTFDIIGSLVIDTDLCAQSEPGKRGELIQLFNEMMRTYSDEKSSLPWWIIPFKARKRSLVGARMNELIQDLIRRKHAEQQQRGLNSERTSRSIMALSPQDTKELSSELVSTICDQIKTFLMAGHDTTSTSLAWIIYELSRTPRALSAVRTELNELLGSDSDLKVVTSKLLSTDGPHFVRGMKYISAVIKETLRLHPPAGTARFGPPGDGFKVRTPEGDEYCLDGLTVYICQPLVHRDKSVFGETAGEFRPERWLDGAVDGNTEGNFPAGAWRPFERGPRNCIGQEFANIELRVIIALIIRRYDFTKVGLGETSLDENGHPTLLPSGQYAVESEVYNVRIPPYPSYFTFSP